MNTSKKLPASAAGLLIATSTAFAQVASTDLSALKFIEKTNSPNPDACYLQTSEGLIVPLGQSGAFDMMRNNYPLMVDSGGSQPTTSESTTLLLTDFSKPQKKLSYSYIVEGDEVRSDQLSNTDPEKCYVVSGAENTYDQVKEIGPKYSFEACYQTYKCDFNDDLTTVDCGLTPTTQDQLMRRFKYIIETTPPLEPSEKRIKPHSTEQVYEYVGDAAPLKPKPFG